MAPETTGPATFEELPKDAQQRRAGTTKDPTSEGAEAPKKSEAAKHLSDIHLGPRWQIARYQQNPADDFCKDIYFGARKISDPAVAQADKREIEFKHKVEETLSTLKAIFRPPEPDDRARDGLVRRTLRKLRPPRVSHSKQWIAARRTRFNEAYDRLFSLTVLGLATDVDLAIADASLNSLRADVLRREMGPIKNAYMRNLGRPALAAGVVLLLLFLLYDKSPGFFAALCGGEGGLPRLACDPVEDTQFRALFPNEVYEYRAIFLLLAGCMMGTWASFAARKVKLAFSDLAELEQDALAPRMRLLFTGVLTFIFALVFLTGLVQIEIGGFSTERLAGDGLVAVLMGAFFGLLEQALPAAVMERARGFVETVTAK